MPNSPTSNFSAARSTNKSGKFAQKIIRNRLRDLGNEVKKPRLGSTRETKMWKNAVKHLPPGPIRDKVIKDGILSPNPAVRTLAYLWLSTLDLP
jgi:hypothetical protein